MSQFKSKLEKFITSYDSCFKVMYNRLKQKDEEQLANTNKNNDSATARNGILSFNSLEMTAAEEQMSAERKGRNRGPQTNKKTT